MLVEIGVFMSGKDLEKIILAGLVPSNEGYQPEVEIKMIEPMRVEVTKGYQPPTAKERVTTPPPKKP